MEVLLAILACAISIAITGIGMFIILSLEFNAIKNTYVEIILHMLLIMALSLLIIAPFYVIEFFI